MKSTISLRIRGDLFDSSSATARHLEHLKGYPSLKEASAIPK